MSSVRTILVAYIPAISAYSVPTFKNVILVTYSAQNGPRGALILTLGHFGLSHFLFIIVQNEKFLMETLITET